VFVSNGVDDGIETVHVGSHAYGGFFNSGINFRNDLDFRVHRLRVLPDFVEEVGEGLHAKIYPLAEVGVGEVAELQVLLCIQSGGFTKRFDGVVIETGPSVLPTLEVGHPVGNIDINAVDSGSGNLPDALHVDPAPLGSVGTYPDVFIPLLDPECRSPAKNRRLSG